MVGHLIIWDLYDLKSTVMFFVMVKVENLNYKVAAMEAPTGCGGSFFLLLMRSKNEINKQRKIILCLISSQRRRS